jgi:hypothetical protein
VDLAAKKENLWKTRNTAAWHCQAPITDIILSDKHLAYEVMLPTETQAVEDLKDLYGYFNYRAVSEFKRVYRAVELALYGAFAKFGTEQVQSLA